MSGLSPRTPLRSMSPVTVERTSVSRTPRAAAMLARPAVRQVARACSTYSTGVGPLSRPTRTAGWSASNWKLRSWVRSAPTPKKPSMVLRLWVPLSHSLLARNWNRAASGAALTASRVANRAVVSTPLRIDVSVVVMSGLLGSGGGELVLARSGAGGQFDRLDVEGVAELPLQL